MENNKTKLIIGVVLFLLVVVGAGLFKFYGNPFENNTSENYSDGSSNVNRMPSKKNGTPSSKQPTPSTLSGVDIAVNEPKIGVIKGIVELGASGLNKFVVKTDTQGNYKVLSKDFGRSLAYEGMANSKDIRDKLREYIGKMGDEGVSGKNIHFVISSGALKNPKTSLISNELKAMGYFVNEITPQKEGEYAFKTIPIDYQSSSTSIDIGSGNTKVTWMQNGTLKSVELPGSKYSQDGTISDEDVYSKVNTAIKSIPENLRKQIFIIGGVPYQLAKEHREGRFTQMKSPDDYNAPDEKTRAGLNIYKAIYDSGDSTIVFDDDANFSLGFLLSIK